MRIALLHQKDNFVGREYFAAMTAAGRAPDFVVTVGQMSEKSIAIETERTGGLWSPPSIPEVVVQGAFENISDSRLLLLLEAMEVDVAIQGGIGILKNQLLTVPRIGWINVHPGKLPEYRGNACPEWALLNGDPVFATAHFIDEGIDTGPVICEARYDIADDWSYHQFRANLYKHCAMVLVTALDRLEHAGRNAGGVAVRQSEQGVRYWPQLGPSERIRVRSLFDSVGESSS